MNVIDEYFLWLNGKISEERSFAMGSFEQWLHATIHPHCSFDEYSKIWNETYDCEGSWEEAHNVTYKIMKQKYKFKTDFNELLDE